jgi:pimeloyl-ACP methyl ester carboxylesterase
MANFMLIHGAFQGGWIWKLVAERLRSKGHSVYVPTLDGCAERAMNIRSGISTETHAQEVARFLWSEDVKNLTLVGASAGGMVMTRVAELQRDRIERLVFADALALMNGECIRDITGSSHHSVVTDLVTGPTREDRFERFVKDMDQDLAAWAADRSTPHPIGCFNEPVILENFWQKKWNASVIWCKQAGRPGVEHQRRAAEALSAKWFELDTGHFPQLSMPDELSGIILGEA